MLGLRGHLPAHERLNMNFELAWMHSFGNQTWNRTMAFRQGSDNFDIKGVTLSRDEVVLGVGMEYKFTDNVIASLNYDGSLGDRGQSHGGALTLIITW